MVRSHWCPSPGLKSHGFEGVIRVPHTYIDGYARACEIDREAADNYARHTLVGDPELDPVMEEVAVLPPDELNRFVAAGIERQDSTLRKAPGPLQAFFDNSQEPDWLDHEAFQSGCRVFHKNADLMLVAFVTAVLVEGFSTLIAKSFRITGRVALTERRLRQNNRQMLEIFMPGGLQGFGDGRKLSIRVRFVHARIRYLLAKSEEWRHEDWGVPLSAAHLGLALSVFSQRLLDYASLLGAKFTRAERSSILAIWRYTGHLMGIPEPVLYTDSASAKRVYTVGFQCEPPPDDDSAAMANALIRSIPRVVGMKDQAETDKVLHVAYGLSRALIGKRLADSFKYPKQSTLGALFMFRAKQRASRLFKREKGLRFGNFTQLLQISVYDGAGLSHKLPDHVRASESSPW